MAQAKYALTRASLQGFSIFIGLGIHNCVMYENATKLNARQSVALEILAYHASSSIEETVDFMVGEQMQTLGT